MRISDWSSDVCSSDLIVCTSDADQPTGIDPGSSRRSRRLHLERDKAIEMGPDVTMLHCERAHPLRIIADREFLRHAHAAMALDRLLGDQPAGLRSEERRVGKASVSQCRYRSVPSS